MDSGLNLTSEPGLQTPDTDCLLNCACSRSTNIYRASVTLRIGIKSWADENMGDISDFNLIIVWHEIQRKSYLIDTEECRIQACMGERTFNHNRSKDEGKEENICKPRAAFMGKATFPTIPRGLETQFTL